VIIHLHRSELRFAVLDTGGKQAKYLQGLTEVTRLFVVARTNGHGVV